MCAWFFLFVAFGGFCGMCVEGENDSMVGRLRPRLCLLFLSLCHAISSPFFFPFFLISLWVLFFFFLVHSRASAGATRWRQQRNRRTEKGRVGEEGRSRGVPLH